MIKAIIVDDERKARELLHKFIGDYCKSVQVVAKCSSVPQAVIEINKHNPDVVFCDIEMPDYNGFELLTFFKEVSFEIVFVTAYNEYAIKAFEVSAIDYLLKPVQIHQLERAVAKLENKLEETNLINERIEVLKNNMSNEKIPRIALPVLDGLIFIDTVDIAFIQAERSYAYVWKNDGSKILVSKRLKFFEFLLRDNFFRIHRSSIINMSYVERYSKAESYVYLKNKQALPISRDNKSAFENRIKSIRV